MGEINLIPARLAPGSATVLETALGPIALPPGAVPQGPCHLAIRPEQLGPAPQDGGAPGVLRLPGTVLDSAFFGTHHRVSLQPSPAGPPLIAHLPQRLTPEPGARLVLALDPADAVILPDDAAEERP
ncbi:MAG: TOBE domain-containing protein [Pseudomonadota bacterium]